MANILVVGPHPDDQELGMGGTIARLADQGHNILLVDMTDGSPTPHGDRSTRLPEAQAALEALQPGPGKPRIRRVLLDLPNRRVVHSVEARHLVAGQIRSHQASIVFCPHPLDAHPDHVATTRIVEDARFDAKLTRQPMPGDEGRPPLYPKWLFQYYCTHLRRIPDPMFLIDVSGYTPKRRAAIEAYRTQFAMNPLAAGMLERLEAGLVFYGSRIGTGAAEPFSCPEPLGLTGLDCLAL
ncbi:MAG: PIG-L family deacetylase [Phycisphaerales bacterium]|nr:PIG-L family deacetylase [Planctomycetota bacterium]